MERYFLKSKLHRATITGANLEYEGSLSIDPELMKAAEILPFEKVDVVNINTGARFTTYAIKGKVKSGEICFNGGAARLGQIGDKVIILTYTQISEEEIADHRSILVFVSDNNTITQISKEKVI